MGEGPGVGGTMAHSGTQRARGGWWEKGLKRERVGRAWHTLRKIPALSRKESKAIGRALCVFVLFCSICTAVT